MPRSAATLKLSRYAHSLGDKYYRCSTTASRSNDGIDEQCLTLARSYLEALESLRSHLSTLTFDADAATLIQTTENHIALVRKDLQRFENVQTTRA